MDRDLKRLEKKLDEMMVGKIEGVPTFKDFADQQKQTAKDVSEIKVSVGRIDEHLISLNGSIRAHETRLRSVEIDNVEQKKDIKTLIDCNDDRKETDNNLMSWREKILYGTIGILGTSVISLIVFIYLKDIR